MTPDWVTDTLQMPWSYLWSVVTDHPEVGCAECIAFARYYQGNGEIELAQSFLMLAADYAAEGRY